MLGDVPHRSFEGLGFDKLPKPQLSTGDLQTFRDAYSRYCATSPECAWEVPGFCTRGCIQLLQLYALITINVAPRQPSILAQE